MATSSVGSAQYIGVATSVESIAYLPGATPANITHSEVNTQNLALGAASTPAVSNVSVFQIVSPTTINLYTDLLDGAGSVITPSTIFPVMMKFVNVSTSTSAPTPISASSAASSNGYPMSFPIPSRGEVVFYDNGAGPSPSLSSISSSQCKLAFSGAGKINCTVWLG